MEICPSPSFEAAGPASRHSMSDLSDIEPTLGPHAGVAWVVENI